MDPNFKPVRIGGVEALERYPCGKAVGEKGRAKVYYLCRCLSCKFDSCRAHQNAKNPIGKGRVFLCRNSYWLFLSFSVIAAAFFFCERTMLSQAMM